VERAADRAAAADALPADVRVRRIRDPRHGLSVIR
jgi:hypothetical protein